MDRRLWTARILTMGLLLGLLTGCGGSAPAPEMTKAPAAAVTVTDMTGRTVTLDAPADRVVALTAADCEVLYAIGAGETIVGRGAYCDYPAEVLEVPAVQNGNDINIEQILALEPQVVLTNTTTQTDEQVETLERAGIRVVMSHEEDIAGVYAYISLVGAVTGKNEEAAALVAEMRSSLETLARSVPDGEERTIYFEVSPLEYGLWTAGEATFMNEIGKILGLKNIFEDVEDWGEVSEEQVIQRDPDYIVTITMYNGSGVTPEEEILSRAGWETITAVKNGAVLNLQNEELSCPSHRLVEGAGLLYEFVYGEDGDPAA